MFSSIETNYLGCREQALPWNQPQDWCLCQGNLCNSKSMSDIGGRRGEGPQIKLKEDTHRLPIGKSGDENSQELQASSTPSSVTPQVLPWWWWYVNWSTEKSQAVQATTPKPTTTTTTTVAPTNFPDSKPILPWWWWYVHWSTEKPAWLWQENTDYNDYGEKENIAEEGTKTTESLYPWWIGRHSTMHPLAPSTVDWESLPSNPPEVDDRNKLKQQDKAIEKAADNVTLKKGTRHPSSQKMSSFHILCIILRHVRLIFDRSTPNHQ